MEYSARRGLLVAALTIFALLAAGCSASGGGSSGGSSIDYGLALQGATNDHPATPPTVASGGPDVEYAFVYDNQVWVRQKGNNAPRQVTQLALSAGAELIWGPLVWSASGKSLAFALIQNLTPSQPTGDSGPLYYVDLSQCLSSASTACSTYRTPMTGSVYGHTYTWFKDAYLIAGNGGGVSAYDVHDPQGPRVWQLRTEQGEQRDPNQQDGCPAPTSYSDVWAVNGSANLFYTFMCLSNIGSTGAQGSAYLDVMTLQPFVDAGFESDAVTRDQNLGQAQYNGGGPYGGFYANGFASLGSVYAGPGGDPVAGSWAVSGDGGTIAYESISNVNAKAGTALRSLCKTNAYGYNCSNPLPSVKTIPTNLHAQVSLSPGGSVSYQADHLYATGFQLTMNTASPYAAVWATDDTLLVTTVLSTTTDASGVTRQITNVQTAHASGLTALVTGARDVAVHS
jgi:hypothetical protein